MASNPIKFYLKQRKQNDPKNPHDKSKQRTVVQAYPIPRGKISFRNFCEVVARSTTFNEQEVYAVLNYAITVAREYVSNGMTVQFGDMGSLTPTFQSKVADSEADFDAFTHIHRPRVRLSPSRLYFDLSKVAGVHFERAAAPEIKKKGRELREGLEKHNAPATPGAAPSTPGATPGKPAGDEHLGI